MKIILNEEGLFFNKCNVNPRLTEKRLVELLGHPSRIQRHGGVVFNGTYFYDNVGLAVEFSHAYAGTIIINFEKECMFGERFKTDKVFSGGITINNIAYSKKEGDSEEVKVKIANKIVSDLKAHKLLYSDGRINDFNSTIRIANYRLNLSVVKNRVRMHIGMPERLRYSNKKKTSPI